MSKSLCAIHGENDLHYDGWVVLTRGIGRNPTDHHGEDFTRLRQTPIVRLNHGYSPHGTIPLPEHYEAFAQRCANFVAASKGCTRWIIGNEPSHSQERPEGRPILPTDYARCYNYCRQAIHAIAPDHEVLLGAVAPYNNQTAYSGNESGDWIQYFRDIQQNISGCDGFAIHAYARVQTPSNVTSPDKMGNPFSAHHNGFLVYRDWMRAMLPRYHGLSVYITETNAMGPWQDVDTGFVVQLYQEVYAWNKAHPDRPISCVALYRWQYDKWTIKDKPKVIADFMRAVECNLTWPPITDPPPEPEPEPPQDDTRLALLEVQVAQVEARVTQLEATLAGTLDRIEAAGRVLAGE